MSGSFLDRAKAKANELTNKAQEAYEDVQGKRKADGLLDDLGRIVYADRTGRTMPNADAEMDRLVAELQKLEAEGVPVLAPPPPPPPPAPPTAPGGGPSTMPPPPTPPAAPGPADVLPGGMPPPPAGPVGNPNDIMPS
jgi:hypothetical protein